MIQPQTRLKVADNTGARSIQCIRVMGRSLKTTAGVGDVILASVKQAIPNAAVKKGDVVRAVIVRTDSTRSRSCIRTFVRVSSGALRKATRTSTCHASRSGNTARTSAAVNFVSVMG